MRERFEVLGGRLSISSAPVVDSACKGIFPRRRHFVIRVCLADDQTLFRSGMRALLALFEGI